MVPTITLVVVVVVVVVVVGGGEGAISTYCVKQTEMVFERDIPSCSPHEVLIRYLRSALIDNHNKSKTELTAIEFLSGWKT